MTYQRIFELKFKGDVPTHELERRFPKERKKISRIALLELPLSQLRKLVKQEKEFQRLVSLKKWLFAKAAIQRKKAFQEKT